MISHLNNNNNKIYHISKRIGPGKDILNQGLGKSSMIAPPKHLFHTKRKEGEAAGGKREGGRGEKGKVIGDSIKLEDPHANL